MSKSQHSNFDKFFDVRTAHYAQINWHWKESKLHDYEHHIKVYDAVKKVVKEVESEFDIYNNTSYRCQAEGVEIYGEDLEQVTEAAKKVVLVLLRFKGILPV